MEKTTDSAIRELPARRNFGCESQTTPTSSPMMGRSAETNITTLPRFAVRNSLDLELSKKTSKLMQNSPHRNRSSDTGDFVSEMFLDTTASPPTDQMKLLLTPAT